MELTDAQEFERFIRSHPLALVYFSSPDCAVCEALRPKVQAVVSRDFPNLPFAVVDCAGAADVAAAQQVFSAPTVALYVEGREAFRKLRGFGVSELRDAIERPYSLLTGEPPRR